MYLSFSPEDPIVLKSQIREQIFSLLGNSGKTLVTERSWLYAWVDISWYKKIESIVENIWFNPYKRIFAYIGIVIASTMLVPPQSSFAQIDTPPVPKTATFIVTAYYSPLPWQLSYARGSLAADKKLNGNGTHGASGTPVFTGMIAAPKSYDFGTHIFFEWLGLGRVEDRWGAIVDAWVRWQPHDRIDIWMWHGDTWLKRARAWWVREVTGVFVSPEQAKNLNAIDLEGIEKGRVNLSDFPTTKAQSQWGISAEIIEAFAELGYIVKEWDVKAMIFDFQVDQWILSSLSDAWAGNFWPKTKAAFSEEYKKYTTLKNLDLDAIERARKELLDERVAWDIRYQKAQISVQSMSVIRPWDTNTSVMTLQSFLSGEWIYRGKIDGQMRGSTILALKRYQKANGLKQTGRIDGSTQRLLVQDLLEA